MSEHFPAPFSPSSVFPPGISHGCCGRPRALGVLVFQSSLFAFHLRAFCREGLVPRGSLLSCMQPANNPLRSAGCLCGRLGLQDSRSVLRLTPLHSLPACSHTPSTSPTLGGAALLAVKYRSEDSSTPAALALMALSSHHLFWPFSVLVILPLYPDPVHQVKGTVSWPRDHSEVVA